MQHKPTPHDQTIGSPQQFSIFNVKINNLSMADSVALLTHHRPAARPLVGYFVNANSLNIAFKRKRPI